MDRSPLGRIWAFPDQNGGSRVLASSFTVAKSSCAKLRNLMSVLFKLFDRNPIRFVRQSAKRRTAPTLLAPIEIKMLVEDLGLRERTLVLLAASTGLRQSELFGLKWGDIDFAAAVMNVTRSVVYGVVGPCKTDSLRRYIRPAAKNQGIEKRIGWHTFRRTYATLPRNCP